MIFIIMCFNPITITKLSSRILQTKPIYLCTRNPKCFITATQADFIAPICTHKHSAHNHSHVLIDMCRHCLLAINDALHLDLLDLCMYT